MEADARVTLITDLENLLGARIISYVLADKLQGPQASIAMDALGLFYRHLECIGDTPSIALYLYSRGGDTMVPWRLVNLIREYCSSFVALVPYKAHSAATLICLGADKIVMGKMGELSPVDPSVANDFNPSAPQGAGAARIPISVEDVSAYFKLATERAGLTTPETKLGAFQQLTQHVHPLALGNVARSHSQIRELSRKLLELHMKAGSDDEKTAISGIVDVLTEKLYSHQHLIPRNEARDLIGLPVEYASPEVERLMWELFDVYQVDLGIGTALNTAQLLGNDAEVDISLAIARIETRDSEDDFLMSGKITRSPQQGQPPVVNVSDQGWRTVR
jgi:hypothetical protein